MAYQASEEYKKLIYDESTNQTINVIINGNIINGDYVRGLNFKDNVFDSDNFSLGSAIPKHIELELNNDVLENIGSFDEVSLVFNLYIDDNTTESVPLGTYKISQDPDNNSQYYTKYVLEDYMSKFDFEFDGSEIVPCTRYELLKAICDSAGVELENESIINGEVMVGVYDNTINARTYLSFISERSGGFAKITRNNKLRIKSFGEVDSHNLPENMIGEYKCGNLKTISKIVYQTATEYYENGTDDGEVIYLSTESPFSCSQEEIDRISELLIGLKYQSVDVRIWGDPTVDSGDIISSLDFVSFAQPDWTFGNGFYGKYNTQLNSISNIQNVTKISNKKMIKKLQSKIDEMNGEIRILAETQETDYDSLNESLNSVQQIINSNSETIEVIDKKITDGVELLKNTLVTIDINGIKVATNLSKISTIMTNDTFAIQDNAGTYLAYFGYDEEEGRSKAEMDNLTINNYFTAGYHRQEKFEIDGEKRTGWFYVGGSI